MIQQQSRLRRHLWLAGIAIAAALSATVSHARGSIEVGNRAPQGGAEVLRIEFQTDRAAHRHAVQTPARIALDFPGVLPMHPGRSLVEISQGNVRVGPSSRPASARIVLNLKQRADLPRRTARQRRCWCLDSVTSACVPTGPSAVFAEGHNADVLPLKDLDFRRGSDGAGRIVVGLASNQGGRRFGDPGQGLVVEFQRSSLPEGLRRRLDMSDFGTPVADHHRRPAGASACA